MDDAPEVDAEDLAPARQRSPALRAVADGGVVHQHMHGAERGIGLVAQPLDIREFRDVADDRARSAGKRRTAASSARAVEQQSFIPRSANIRRGGAADAARGAGDDGDIPLNTLISSPPLAASPARDWRRQITLSWSRRRVYNATRQPRVSRMSANLHDTLRARATDPTKPRSRRRTGRALLRRVVRARGRAARALVELGVEPGDRVAAQIDKSPDAIVLALACFRAGAALLPLNTAYTLAELEYFLGDAEPALTLCPPARARGDARARRQARLARGRKPRRPRRRRRSATRIDAARRNCRRVARARRRSRRDPLHLGHDRPLQGRDADAREPRLERARRWSISGASPATTC